MREELFESLAFQWPYLFEKSDINHISCDDGWYGIIECFCESVCQRVESAKSLVIYLKEKYELSESADVESELKYAEISLQEAIDALPALRQIKEKFGSLRIYADNVNDECQLLITHTELLSMKICEHCGSPAKITGGRRYSCHCEKCLKIGNKMYDGVLPTLPITDVAPNFIETEWITTNSKETR